jgi:signal transduction histidine kinase/ligand-binding sensor domain-containing protein
MAPCRWLALALVCLSGLVLPARLFALDPTRSIAQLHHTAWTIADGIPANIWAIAQTPDGYLWLGSVNGLYRFDGVRVERMAVDKLPSPSIHALAATASGGLWIGYERPVGTISYLHDGVVTNYPVKLRNSTSVHAFAVGPDGTVWASTPDAILRFDGKRWLPVKGDFGFSFSEGKGGVWSFGVARDGTVWSKNLGGLYYFRPGQAQFERVPGSWGGPEGFTTTRDGRLWTTDAHTPHLYAMPDLAGSGPLTRLVVQAGAAVPNRIEGPILLDHDGTLWCSSVGGGGLRRARSVPGGMILDRAAQSPGSSLTSSGLTSDLVHTLFEDREGNIWIGTGLGLDRFRPANIVTEPSVPAGFRARFVGATSLGLLAYTGWSGTASRADGGTQALYRVRPGQAPDLFVANVGRLRGMFTRSRDGTIWLITQNGVQQLLGRTLGPPLPLPAGVEGVSVYSAAYDNQGTLWISSFVHGVFRRTADGWHPFALRSPVGATGVLIPDPDGSMWIRYSGGGLFRIRGDREQDLSHNGLNIGDVTFIQPQGRSLMIGGENGIGSLKDGQFHALHAGAIPSLSGVTGIARTVDGSTWIFAEAGILRANTQSLEAALAHSDPRLLHYELLDTRDGLPGAPYGAVGGSSVATDAAGRVWFTTGNGLVWIDPNNLHHNSLAPNVVVDSLVADGRRHAAGPALSLAAGTSNVEIDYTALSLSIPDRVRFRYKLDGIDSGWVDAANRRQAFYTRLGPGEYNFHVIAANSDGVWNTRGATLTFVIPPTFLQSRLFMVMCAIALIAVAQLAYSMRLAQLSARLRSQLEARMSERERIARELHDTLLQGFQGLMLRFQSVADMVGADHPAHRLLDLAMKRGDAALIEGRNRVRDLRQFESVDDLRGTLHGLAGRLRLDEAIAFQVVDKGPSRKLNPIAIDEVIKISAEAMLNAFRHAQATMVAVSILYGKEALRVVIEDDGVGIPGHILKAGRREGHFGLVGMRERASRIEATIGFSMREPAGTSIELVIPAFVIYADLPRLRWPIWTWVKGFWNRHAAGRGR